MLLPRHGRCISLRLLSARVRGKDGGLPFASNGDVTCAVAYVGYCDAELVTPSHSTLTKIGDGKPKSRPVI